MHSVVESKGLLTYAFARPMSEAPDPSPAVPRADPADVDSLDAIVTAVYASVSFVSGEQPAWDRFRSLFDPRALLVRIDPRVTTLPASEREQSSDPPVVLSSIEEYIARTHSAIEGGSLTAFTERELTRRTEVFADLAQVFSTYERSAAAGDVRRGINSLSLVKDGERWWIVSLCWTDETDAGPLPSHYLPRS